MIIDNSLWDTESSYDVVKNKECCNMEIVKKCMNILIPFNKVIDGNNDITMPPRLRWDYIA
jgi:hypothetical protein